MKILILLIVATLVTANSTDILQDDCREPLNIQTCEIWCKFLGLNGWSCDGHNGCKCYKIPDENQVQPKSFIDDANFKCLTNPDREFCQSYCKRKGFVAYSCDLETVCSCYGEPIPYAENKNEKINSDKPKVQCYPKLNGDLTCYNYCKNLNMRFGKCQSDGQCNCYDIDIAPIFEDEKPERKCYPGLEHDMTCYRYCKMSGLKFGKCDENGKCQCYDRDFMPY